MIHYSDDCCLLIFKGYEIVGVITFSSWVYYIYLFMSSIRSVIVSSIIFVSAIAISIIFLVVYIIFLIIRVSGNPVSWFTYWSPVFFKPLFFLWKLLYVFKLFCLTLFSPLFLQYYCNVFIEIPFYKTCHFVVILFYRF